MGQGSSLKCSNLSHLYLLLKSSDFVCHDLTQPFAACEGVVEGEEEEVEYCLVLRRWEEVNPGTEWRCFVRGSRLVAASQRDPASHYPHIQAQEESVRRDLTTFYREQVRGRFPLTTFVMDVARPGKDRVTLVDFNPWRATTDPILYTWEELEEEEEEVEGQVVVEVREEGEEEEVEVELRYIESPVGVQPSPHREFSLPRDLVELGRGEDPAKLIDFLRLQGQVAAGEGEDSGEES